MACVIGSHWIRVWKWGTNERIFFLFASFIVSVICKAISNYDQIRWNLSILKNR